jgi:hypothetical protein
MLPELRHQEGVWRADVSDDQPAEVVNATIAMLGGSVEFAVPIIVGLPSSHQFIATVCQSRAAAESECRGYRFSMRRMSFIIEVRQLAIASASRAPDAPPAQLSER